ncbi:MAG: hypothetical protein BGP16_13510 [Sphingobium sp. 66-54]|nr:MAG: hypothetical protein BGP16_13510 [Sphingobium sp. 66-54]
MKYSNRITTSLALGAVVLALAACKSEPESVNLGTNDPMDSALANAAPVELPPMLKSSHSYRCKDNSLIFVDFMTDDKTANFKADKEGPVTVLKAPEAGQPFVSADGKTTVTSSGDGVTYNGQSCKTG